MIYVLTGPTATGKSKTALFLASKLNAEIVNGDAFQVYKEMNIGVAKPDEKDMSLVPHHLYSFIDVKHNYSIAEYQLNLREKINELTSKGKNILLVGGSGLYIRSALFDYKFSEEKEVDLSKYEVLDDKALHDELAKIDPIEAGKIHMNNRKRVLRAIQIYLSSGKTKSEIIKEQHHEPIYKCRFFTKDIEREVLYSLINQRVDEMIDKGLVDEVKELLNIVNKDAQCLQAIGYKEFILYFDGKIDLKTAIEQIKQNTRNYAKRQMTFIRHQFNVEFYKDNNELLEIIQNG